MKHSPNKTGVVDVYAPKSPLAPVVLDSPHSGTDYPADFGYSIAMEHLRYGVDFEIDNLFGSAPTFGAWLVAARFPRSYIDPNRSTADLDTRMIDGEWPETIDPSVKSASGHGLIWKVAGRSSRPIYNRLLSVAEVRNRIESYWRPYRQVLADRLEKTAADFGGYWHINCHSMPSHWPHGFEGAGTSVPYDVIIGTRDGMTCSQEVAHHARDLLAGLGLNVAVDVGFKGVDLIVDHGDPAADRHSLQIEINRGLYMDEIRFQRSDGYEPLRDALTQFIDSFTADARAAYKIPARRSNGLFHTF